MDGLRAANEGILAALRELALAGVSAEHYRDLDALRWEIRPPEGPADPLMVSDREEDLIEWLEDRGVDRAWEIAMMVTAWTQQPRSAHSKPSSRRVVERHGGDIHIDSEPGPTLVRVTLPTTPLKA